MKDWNREQVARHLFDVMNNGRYKDADGIWRWYNQEGFNAGYYRLADEIITKGYKP
jgi:hypothetical protein